MNKCPFCHPTSLAQPFVRFVYGGLISDCAHHGCLSLDGGRSHALYSFIHSFFHSTTLDYFQLKIVGKMQTEFTILNICVSLLQELLHVQCFLFNERFTNILSHFNIHLKRVEVKLFNLKILI